MENQIKIENTLKSGGESSSSLENDLRKGDAKISKMLNPENYVNNESIVKNIPFVLFVAALMVFYIWNSHQTEKMIREKNKIGKQLNELRWEYMTSKNELMLKSKQTEVIKLLQDSTLQVLTSSPKKILVDKDKYK